MSKVFEKFDFDTFWKKSDYATENYISEPPTDELINSIEKELGHKLPFSYIEFMKVQNGGIPYKNSFPTNERTSWVEDHVAVTGFLSIGKEKMYSLCGGLGSQFMIDEWGYPKIGVYFADCPSAGHDMICFDYRKHGKNGEPQVVHIDQEDDYKITFLANNFEKFVTGLVNEYVFEEID